MVRFLLVYLSVYPLVHYYAYRCIRAGLVLNRKARIGLVAFMAVMVFAPIVVRLAERVGIETGARFWAYTSFSWMGLLFLFVVSSAAADVTRFLVLVAEKVQKRKFALVRVSPRQLLAAQAMLVFAVYGYGLFEAANIRLEYIEIESPKIAEGSGRVRIAQISDVHLGLIVGGERLRRIIARIEEAKPDILVSTGDLVDGQLNHIGKEAELFAALNPPLGKFAIAGNHEFYAGPQDAFAFIEKSGFTLLRHQGVGLGGINLVGLDDRAGKSFGEEHAGSEREVLAAQPTVNFTVLLKHRPEIDPDSLGLFDLQLSGHTHKGQIFPFNLLTWFFYPQRSGRLTRLEDGFLYLSPGTATWGPPIRFLAPPEVTIIDLVGEKGTH